MSDGWSPVDQHGHPGVLGAVIDQLVAIEQHHHDAGWDNTPATLYGIYREPSGGGYRHVRCRLGMTDMHPRDELAALAHGYEHADTLIRTLVLSIYPAAPVGHAIVMEAWQQEGTAESMEEFERTRAGRMLADIPGSTECRFGFAMVARHHVMLRRTRGTTPVLCVVPPEDEATIGGGMFLSLRRFHLAALGIFRDASAATR